MVEHKANNATTPERTALGKQTYLVDGNTGEGSFKEQETGQIVPSFDRSEGFHEEPRQEPAQDNAEGKFREAELRQVEADAATIGIPQLRAKKNVEIKGVGRKFSGIYYCHSVRHSISGAGYLCELKLKKNALGKGRGRQVRRVPGQTQRQGGPAHAAKRAASHGDHRRGFRRGHTRRRQWVISARISTVRNSPARARTAAAIRLRSIPTWSTPCRRCATGIGKPLSITSGFRCNRHNKAVGGAEQSFHTLGMAADVSCPAGVSPRNWRSSPEEIPLFCEGGIGVYASWVHLDVRQSGKARWRCMSAENKTLFSGTALGLSGPLRVEILPRNDRPG